MRQGDRYSIDGEFRAIVGERLGCLEDEEIKKNRIKKRQLTRSNAGEPFSTFISTLLPYVCLHTRSNAFSIIGSVISQGISPPRKKPIRFGITMSRQASLSLAPFGRSSNTLRLVPFA